MLNKTKKCVSKCINRPREKCYKGCVFTQKKYCKLSSKYKMDPNKDCKIVLNKYNNLRRELTPLNMPEKEILSPIQSYSPKINEFLIQSRISPKYDIFNAILQCMNLNIEQYKLKDSILKYYINPKIKLENGECVSYWNKEAQKLFLDNLSKHHIIDVKKLIGPKQSYYNCWFNTGFMINYISDKGRKFNKYFRQFMITGKSPKMKSYIKKIKAPLFLFNVAIEATLQGNELANIMNTNDIIEKIYESIPKEYKKTKYIFNKKDYGNPYIYQLSLLNYLSNKVDYHFTSGKLLFEYNDDHDKITNDEDVLWVEITNEESNIIKTKKEKLLGDKNIIYKLDSVLLRDIDKKHFCCLITIHNKEYIYDGASEPSLKFFPWKKYINTNKSFRLDNYSAKWNFMNGYQVLNYYRINK